MALVEISKVKKEFGEDLLFKDVTFSIEKKDRIALIGNNGCGKTTLIKMILKQMEYDSGSINVSSGTSIGYLSQGVITNLDHTLYSLLILVRQYIELRVASCIRGPAHTYRSHTL